ncbi:MAG: amidohydrolase [Candidatus Nanopelagicales bacterium]|nr:amidohydrolase [Candidatus Nanopelagicales bacterium]
MATMILKASTIITMDEANPRAEAVAFDDVTGKLLAVGTVAQCQAVAPGVSVTDLGSTVLMPGFIEAHSHPMLGGMITQPPCYWIAPYMGYPNISDVHALWTKVNAELPPDQPVVFQGLDRLLQQAEMPTNTDLDTFFPTRRAVVLDNSGHMAYFNSAVIAFNKWVDGKPPPNPPGAHFGRNPDGTSNGIAYETAALLEAALPTVKDAVPKPLESAARWLQYMAGFGITATSEMTYSTSMLKGYEALTTRPDSPVRMSLYHMAIDSDAGVQVDSPDPSMLRKQGVKLWADGSPWVGSIASSFPYLDSPAVQKAQIPLGPGGTAMMNYTRVELDALLAKYAPMGWQMAFHVNGDVGLDIVLDAYEEALVDNNLMGTDHRWRVEHCGGCRGDQFVRAVAMGVTISLGPFQYIYWGDLLDGTMFPPGFGSQWMRWGDAVRAGAHLSFHNDGPVSPPNPLLNIQTAITRTTDTGQVHGANQIISIDDALKAETTGAAYMLHREDEIGSLTVGKYADFVELSMDPYLADPLTLASQVKVQGTWRSGRTIDLDAYLAQIQAVEAAGTHPVDHATAIKSHTC